MTLPTEGRGETVCRGCGGGPLDSALDLGLMPIANELPTADATLAERFPLHLRICRSCALGQVGEAVPRERLFSAEYPYFSGTSSTWAAHCRELVDHLVDELNLRGGDLCIEIASNDGTLLEHAASRGLDVLGIEPAKSVAEAAEGKGVPTVQAFFGAEVARAVVAEHGVPRLVIANNVMAHVPDLADFLEGLALLAGPDTVITVENPDLLTMLENTYFDTIYHEHFSYLSTHAVQRAADRVSLELVRVERLATHGGSLRWWLVPRGQRALDHSVAEALALEEAHGLTDQALHRDFADRAKAVIERLRDWLDEARARGDHVAGYGAAAKGMTLLGAVRATRNDLTVVVDAAPAKQGRFVPGSNIPVTAPEVLTATAPDRILVLPWNIAPEIATQVALLVPGASIWRAVPALAPLDGRTR